MRDEDRLQDILEYAAEAGRICRGGVTAVRADRTKQLAVERALFVIGEAAAGLSQATRDSIDARWRDLIDLRNVLAHQYAAVDIGQLVVFARRDVPPLVRAVQRHLAG